MSDDRLTDQALDSPPTVPGEGRHRSPACPHCGAGSTLALGQPLDPGAVQYKQEQGRPAPGGLSIHVGKSNFSWLKLGSLRVCLECGFVAMFATEEELSRLRKFEG